MATHNHSRTYVKSRILLVMLGLFAAGFAICQPSTQQKLAPGYQELGFTAPIPGSYKLSLLGKAADGKVVDSTNNNLTLHNVMQEAGHSGKIILLSFIYSTCSDVNGCPLAMAVLHKIKIRLKKDPEMAKHLKLLTLSFNPAYDTPERMKEFGSRLQDGEVDWQFLTTRSEHDLQPILTGYHQNIQKIYDANGKFTQTFNHNLRVYLIDQHQQIRNIYNTELLHADTLIADIKTLLLTKPELGNTDLTSPKSPSIYQAGDNKQGYDSKTYETQSVAISKRQGKPADLLKTILQPPLGLPKLPVPADNPITPAKISLGRKLFYDRRLSMNNTFSCAMCHIPEQGFTSNEMATAVGVEGRTVKRNSPALYNVGYQTRLFHDARENTLEHQVWAPLLSHNEMANPSIGNVIDKINRNADYAGLFEQAFGKPPGMENIGMALASYERTLNSGNSPFDRWYFGKDSNALGDQAQRGFALFTGQAHCNQCHTIANQYALFTDNQLHNTGVGFKAAMAKPVKSLQHVQVAPGIYADVPTTVVESVSEIKANDLGRYEVSQNPSDRWHYKTPALRNIMLTAPYMHDGSIATLREVVAFYNEGGIANDNIDPLIKPLQLNEKQIEDLVAFMEALTGDNTEELIADGFAAPVGDR
jgi:cytochrome c peroxidase